MLLILCIIKLDLIDFESTRKTGLNQIIYI